MIVVVAQYVGVYKVPEDAIETTVFYNKLPESSQILIAKYWHERYCKKAADRETYKNKLWNDEDERAAKLLAGEDEGAQMSDFEQRIAAYRVCLNDVNEKWDLTNCEFVRYGDEDLYRTLVKAGAVAEEKGRKKRLSLDPVELGRFQGA